MSNLFGTDGVRGLVGKSPFTLSELPQLGKAIGEWASAKYSSHPHILLAHDTRISKDWITSALTAGILLSPVTIHYAGTLPTPAVLHLVQKKQLFGCGLIISASHNAYQDNGIKIVDGTSGKLSNKDELNISELVHCKAVPTYNSLGSTLQFETAGEEYISFVLSFFKTLSLVGKKIILDCAHGASYKIAPTIFAALGAEVISMHTSPNGQNINKECGAIALRSLQQAVQFYKADIGCAFDGDGDRVILVNKQGIIKNGDDMLALLSNHPAYSQEQTIVGTVMSNQGLQTYLYKKNKTLVRTAVGDRWVASHLNQQGLLLGGEQSGHVILHDFLRSGDGIATALRVIEAIQETDNWQLKTFEVFPQKLVNIPVLKKKDLKEPAIAAIIAKYEKQLDSGRLFVRYSGTENLLRIMVEDREQDAVHRISSQLAQALKQKLQ